MVKDSLIEKADVAQSLGWYNQCSQASGYDNLWSDQNSPPRRHAPSELSSDVGDTDGDGDDTFPRHEEWVERGSPTRSLFGFPENSKRDLA